MDSVCGRGSCAFGHRATVPRIELWCARDVPSSFVCPRDLVCMVVSNVIGAVSGLTADSEFIMINYSHIICL